MSQRNERSTHSKLDGMTHWLIHQAAHRAPESLSSRLEEEWLADSESRSSPLSRLRFGVGCCWATLVIVNDLERSRVPATSTVTGAARGTITLADGNFGYFSLRSGTLFLVAGLHAVLFYGLITTLSHTHGSSKTPDLENHVVEPAPREKLPPPLPTAEMNSRTIDVPKIIVDMPRKFDVETDVTTDSGENPPQSFVPPAAEAPAHVVRQVAGGPGAGFPETADFYPSLSIHLEEEGISAVRVCVDPKGRLTGEPITVKGSGSARLDGGALKLARAGSGHYRPTTEDGQPVNSCYSFGVRFQLKK